jgi:hypothetical protein
MVVLQGVFNQATAWEAVINKIEGRSAVPHSVLDLLAGFFG